jgi:hypothetical protein
MKPAMDLYELMTTIAHGAVFFVIDESQYSNLPYHYFEGLDVASLRYPETESILLVAPHQRLSGKIPLPGLRYGDN